MKKLSIVLLLFCSEFLLANNKPIDSLLLVQQVFNWYQAKSLKINDLDSLHTALTVIDAQHADDQLIDAFKSVTDSIHFDFSNAQSVGGYIQNAEILLRSGYYLKTDCIIYEVMGEHLLKRLADSLDLAFKSKLTTVESKNVNYIRQRLAENNVLIDVRTPNLEKIIQYLKDGRFDYVFHKLKTTYRVIFLIFLAAISFLFLLLFLYKKNRLTHAR
jgi:hypothetical protein